MGNFLLNSTSFEYSLSCTSSRINLVWFRTFPIPVPRTKSTFRMQVELFKIVNKSPFLKISTTSKKLSLSKLCLITYKKIVRLFSYFISLSLILFAENSIMSTVYIFMYISFSFLIILITIFIHLYFFFDRF